MLASLAVAHPLVYRRPRVAILGSGDEIVDVDQPEEILSGRKIASSNTHTLVALVRRAGGEPVNLGIARDTPREPARAPRRARSTATCWSPPPASASASTTTCGPCSRSWAPSSGSGSCGCGRARRSGFGLLGGIPWIGLPGNPVSTMVTFELFVRPAIRKMCGHRPALPPRGVRCGWPSRSRSSRSCSTSFAAIVERSAVDGPEARLTGPQGSGILTSMVLANALLVIPEGQFETPAGRNRQAIRLDDPVHQPEPGF